MATKAKRSLHKYSEQSLQDALSEIRQGKISILGASVKYSVPRSTMQDRLHGRVLEGPRRMGPPTVLTNAEEELLVKWCFDLAKGGFPLKKDDILNAVQTIVKKDKRNTPFPNDRPGRKWFSSFLRRHPNFSLRDVKEISRKKALIREENDIQKWFNELKNFLAVNNALSILEDPSRIFSGDEASFSMCPKTGKVLAPKGYEKKNEKETLRVLLAFSASGDIVDPMIVFPFVRTPKDILNSLPDGYFIGKWKPGRMLNDTFYEYVENCVNNWLNEHYVERPIILFVDGNKFHMTLELSQFCDINQIILYALPPNTKPKMQPTDASVLKPLTMEWSKTVGEWQTRPENCNKTLTKFTFCSLLHMILSASNMEDAIKDGFRNCGLYPSNLDNVEGLQEDGDVKELSNDDDAEELREDEDEDDRKSADATDFENAIAVINLIRPKLMKRGVDTNVVVEEIIALKKRHAT